MKSIFDKNQDCCGCTACKSICPKQAIEMKYDEEGFLYPKIDQDLCINCGMCKEVCAFQNGYDKSQNLKLNDAYGVKHKDINVRMNSRSGGVFIAISDYVLENSGVIYGAGYNGHFIVSHKRADKKSECNEFCGSKYVQSDLGNTYQQVKNDLKNNKLVLFTGTPCQTAGLNKYLSKSFVNKDKLILCDLICHGAPSPKVWKDYIRYSEKKYEGIITKVDFRNKKLFGWSAHRETFIINNKEYDSEIYTKLFYNHDILRPSCYNCKYTNLNRPSDITLADFWGIDEISADFNDNKGVSLILINTEKGRNIFKCIEDKLDYINCTGASFVHPNLKEPTKRPVKRDKFWNDYNKLGIELIINKYVNTGLKGKIKKLIKGKLSKIGLLKYFKKD